MDQRCSVMPVHSGSATGRQRRSPLPHLLVVTIAVACSACAVKLTAKAGNVAANPTDAYNSPPPFARER